MHPPVRRSCDQRGRSSVELAIVAPVLLLVIFGIVQAAVWYTARNAAESSAAACAEAARGITATTADGRAAAASVAGQSGALRDISVDVRATGDEVTCTVGGQGAYLISFGPGLISTSVSMPKDRITRP